MILNKRPKNYRSIFVPLNNILISLYIIIIVSICANIFMFTQSTRLLIDKQQESIVMKASLVINKNINEKIVLLKQAADLINFSINDGKRVEVILSRLYGKDLSFRDLIVFDDYGSMLTRLSKHSKYFFNETLKSIPDDILAGFNNDTTYISNVFIDNKSFEPVVIISVPIKDVFGEVKGSLIAVTNLMFMWDLFADLKIGKTGQAYVIDKKGDLIACKDVSRVLKGENLKNLYEVNNFIHGEANPDKTRSKLRRGIDGKIVVTSHVALGIPDWGVVFEIPLEEAYMPVIWIIFGSIISLVIGIIFSVSSSINVSKVIIKPLSELRDAAIKIGHGNLDFNVNICDKNELGELAESFNTMIDKLSKSTTSIDNLKKEISERIAAEVKLKASEEKFRTLSLELPIGVMLLDRDGTIIFSNEQWEKIFGSNMISESWSGLENIVNDEFINDVKIAWDNLLNKRESFNMEFSIKTDSNEPLWLNIKALSLLSDDGKKIIVLAEDITKRTIAEKEKDQTRIQLIQSEKMAGLGLLAAGIAHEINNPVGFVLGNSETLVDYFKSIKKMCDFCKSNIKDEKIHEMMKILDMEYIINDLEIIIDDNLKGLRRITDIVTNLKNFARIEQGNEIVEANLEDNIKSTILIAKNEIKYHAHVKTEFGHISHVWCNVGEINQVILNMLINAAQAIQQQKRNASGLITVKTWETDADYVFISISDDGPGIEAAYINKIYDPFFSTKPLGKGTGLGLNLAWDIIVNRHMGEIKVSSKIGFGTTFTIKLPIKRENLI